MSIFEWPKEVRGAPAQFFKDCAGVAYCRRLPSCVQFENAEGQLLFFVEGELTEAQADAVASGISCGYWLGHDAKAREIRAALGVRE